MTITLEKLICAKCGTEHDSVPAERTDIWSGKVVTGVWAKDFTYYRDNYLGRGYVPLCNTHKRDSISLKQESDLYLGN